MSDFGPQELLNCYAQGVFPMADSRDDPSLYLLDPEERGIIPLDGLMVSTSLRKSMRKTPFDIRINHDFLATVHMCAEQTVERDNTWINDGIIDLYGHLHTAGYAHSVECYEGERLVGGLYGVSLGGAFFGESMVSRRTNASKIALVKLVERLNARGFVLLDTQFMTEHLRSLGGIEITRAQYKQRLNQALTLECEFD